MTYSLIIPKLDIVVRFDRMLYLGVSDTHQAQFDILEALTRKFRLSPSLNLRDVAERCPFNYTGADFYALCSDAMLNAMLRKAEEVENKLGGCGNSSKGSGISYAIANINASGPQPGHPFPIKPQYYLAEIASSNDIMVVVSQDDFDRAFTALVPSVSQSEMDHYKKIQSRFSRKDSESDTSIRTGTKGKGRAIHQE